MAVNSFTYNLDEVLTHTMLTYRENGKFYDNIFKMNPTMWFLHEKDRKANWEGSGDGRIVVNLQYGTNSTIGPYSKYGTIDTTPQDNQTAAYYDMKQLGGSITIDRFSLRCNRGKAALQSILKTKTQEAEMTMAQDINASLWQVTPATNDITGIPNIIYKSPSSGDTDPGGIAGDGTGNEWWRNQYSAGTGSAAISTWALLNFYMLHIYNDCSKGAALRTSKGSFMGNAPDLLIGTQETWEAYEHSLWNKSRYVNPDAQKAASWGFESIVYRKAVFMWDEMVDDAYTGTYYPTARTTGSLYFILVLIF
jgi:hypothetical protein